MGAANGGKKNNFCLKALPGSRGNGGGNRGCGSRGAANIYITYERHVLKPFA